MFEIAQRSTGRLWIMPCPSGDLRAAVQHYRDQGADHVVSMLARDEAARLGLTEEGPVCESLGLGFTQHQIVDFGLPDLADFSALVDQISALLHAGQGVAVHCRAGIGRSGMVTSGVLVSQGDTAVAAMAKVAHARGVSVPDTVEQGRFISDYAARISGNLGSTD